MRRNQKFRNLTKMLNKKIVRSRAYLQLLSQIWNVLRNKLWTLTPGMKINYFKTPHMSHA
jgi:hypothetical protein